jgi:hypothetical protein
MLSIGSLVPNMCLFIMGLSAQSVVWGCGVCAASIEYALRVAYSGLLTLLDTRATGCTPQ